MIQVDCYLVVKAEVTASGYCRGKPTVRVTKNTPALDRNEVPISVTLRIPETLFRRPQLQAVISIPQEDAPAVITADVADNIADIIRQETGLSVQITIGDADKGE